MKKRNVLGLVIILIGMLFISGCGKKVEHIEGTLEEIMTKMYEGISEEELPMMLSNIEINAENIENFLGTKDLSYETALASESMVGAIAHSVVLIRMKSDADIEQAKNTIKEKVNPRKWICVEAENVIVENKGDLIILIMSGENALKIETNFKNLK